MASAKPSKAAQEPMKALAGITPAQRGNIIDELDQRWCAHALNNLQRAEEATAAGKSFDARNFTWAAGVSTDKVFAIREIPTDTVRHLHAHRVDMGPMLDKLAAASRVLAHHDRRGYLPHEQGKLALQARPVGPVIQAHPSRQETGGTDRP
jgi:hypothetical protein